MTHVTVMYKIVMPGLVPDIHGMPLERQSLLNSGVFPQPV
jgi:hypothetical protein